MRPRRRARSPLRRGARSARRRVRAAPGTATGMPQRAPSRPRRTRSTPRTRVEGRSCGAAAGSRRCAGLRGGRPSTTAEPGVSGSNPRITLISVDLPAPLGPRTAEEVARRDRQLTLVNTAGRRAVRRAASVTAGIAVASARPGACLPMCGDAHRPSPVPGRAERGELTTATARRSPAGVSVW